jgi:hypothetical protein
MLYFVKLFYSSHFTGATVIDIGKTKLKRKRARNDDAEDLDNFQGPWAGFEDESTSAKPSAVSCHWVFKNLDPEFFLILGGYGRNQGFSCQKEEESAGF